MPEHPETLNPRVSLFNMIPEIRKSLVVVVFSDKRLDVFTKGMEILVNGIDTAPIRKVAHG
jgi:hypothetical protein